MLKFAHGNQLIASKITLSNFLQLKGKGRKNQENCEGKVNREQGKRENGEMGKLLRHGKVRITYT